MSKQSEPLPDWYGVKTFDTDSIREAVYDVVREPETTINDIFDSEGATQATTKEILRPLIALLDARNNHLLGEDIGRYQEFLARKTSAPASYLKLLVICNFHLSDGTLAWRVCRDMDKQLSKLWLMLNTKIPVEPNYTGVRHILSSAHTRLRENDYSDSGISQSFHQGEAEPAASDENTALKAEPGPQLPPQPVKVTGRELLKAGTVAATILVLAAVAGIAEPGYWPGFASFGVTSAGIWFYYLISRRPNSEYIPPLPSWEVTADRLEQHLLAADMVPDLEVYITVREIKNRHAGISDKETRFEAIARDLDKLIRGEEKQLEVPAGEEIITRGVWVGDPQADVSKIIAGRVPPRL